MNCWEFMQCGREAGGTKAEVLGVCVAFTKDAGQACWLVAGTLCGGMPHGTFAQRKETCFKCDFYKQFDLDHRLKAMERFDELAQEVLEGG